MALPIPILDDKTFDELVEEARRLIPVYALGWTDHNLHDAGITLVEMLAWLTEMQVYSLDQVTDAHRLKYLQLLGIRPAAARPAKVEAQLMAGDFVIVPAGKELRTGAMETVLTFETGVDIEVIPLTTAIVLSYTNYRYVDVTEFNAHPLTYYHVMGRTPSEGDSLYLGLTTGRSAGELEGKRLRLGINVYEEDLPPVGAGLPGDEDIEDITEIETSVYWTVDVSWELWDNLNQQWKNLSVGAVSTPDGGAAQAFLKSGIIEIEIAGLPEKNAGGTPDYLLEYVGEKADPGALLWIRARLQRAGYDIPPRLDRIILNPVTATEGKSHGEQWKGNGLPHQFFKTLYKPVVPDSLSMTVNGETWTAVMDFDASGPGDRQYTVEPVGGEVRFGDGIHGVVPPGGAEIDVRYRWALLTAATIEAGVLTVIDSPGVTVTNPFPSYGGGEAETIDQAFRRFKIEQGVPCTAVTDEDYEEIVRATPGLRIARAKALVVEEKNLVTVVAVPYSSAEKPLPSEPFKNAVCRYLDFHRPITTGIQVREPDYVKVSAAVEITVAEGYSPEPVKLRVDDALSAFLAPLDTASSSGWPFGRTVYRSEVYERLETVEGVYCVRSLSLSAEEGHHLKINGNIEISSLGLVYSGSHTIDVVEQ
jgi:predicted phage baseplate assembly protein